MRHPAGAVWAEAGTAAWAEPQGSEPAADFEVAEPAVARVALAVAAAGLEVVVVAAAAEPAGGGWRYGGAGIGGAEIAAGDEWQSAAGSPLASAGESAVAAGSASGAGSACRWLQRDKNDRGQR